MSIRPYCRLSREMTVARLYGTSRDSVLLRFMSGKGTWRRGPNDSLYVEFLAGSESYFLRLEHVGKEVTGTAIAVGDIIDNPRTQGTISGAVQPCADAERAT